MTDTSSDLLAAAAIGDLHTIEQANPTDQSTLNSIARTAAKAGQIAILEYSLAQGAAIEQKELVISALEGSAPTPILGCLLDHNLDPNYDLAYLGTPLIMAVQRSELPLVLVLLSHGAKPDVGTFGPGTHTAMSIAAARGDLPILQALLDNGGSVAESGAIQTAAKYGRESVVQLLLERGADPNEVLTGQKSKKLPMSALGEAAKAGKLEMVKLLLDNGARLDVKDSEGKTVLEIAEGSARKDIYEFLWNRH